MSTEFTVNDETFATRFFAGQETGAVVQFEVTEEEFGAFAQEEVFETGFAHGTAAEFVAQVRADGVEVRWDNAHRQNEIARQFEGHRWDFVRDAAVEHRVRASQMVRRSMSVV